MNIELLPEQQEFMASKYAIVIYVGGIRAGKTYVACVKALQNACQGRTQLMIGLTYSQCRDVILDTLLKVMDVFEFVEGKDWKLNKNEMCLVVMGTKIYIRSAQLGDNLRGIEVSDTFIDEGAYHKNDSMFTVALGRMSESDDGQMYITTSPCGFNWIYDKTLQNDSHTIKVSTFKNSFIPTNYIKNMLTQYTSKMIQQELYADFVNFSSGIFEGDWLRTDWAENDQIMKDYPNAKRVRFWDFAFGSGKDADYSAGVLLVKVGDKFIIEDVVRVKQEYTDLRKTIIETAQKDGRDVQIGWEQAGQQKAIISDLSGLPELSGFVKKPLKVAKYGHKMKRILPLASLAECGKLYISNFKNKKEFMNECNSLTFDDTHTNDDMVDACASAYILFNTKFKSAKGSKLSIY